MPTDRIDPPEDLEDQGCRVAHRTVVIQKPVAEVFTYWNDFSRLPEFMYHLQSVEPIGEGRTHWTAHAILGRMVEWEAEVTERIENQCIAWRSLPGGDVDSIGRVEFRSISEGAEDSDGATEVDVLIRYQPTGGEIATTIAEWYDETVSDKLEEDLNNFKQLVEDDEEDEE